MKRRILLSSILVAVAIWAVAQGTAPMPSLARYAPPGALLVVEAQDFSGLVRDWNGSPEKQAWLKSGNFEVFSRSRLYMRLAEVAGEFAAAAGLAPDMRLVDSVAGGESALALYDIGSLQFLYVTKLASARVLESALWRLRSSYETRNSAGMPYFIRTDPTSRRVAAFATAGDYFVVATREDLIAGALALMAGRGGATVEGERWYAESVRAAGGRGDVRLVLDLAALTRSPYFRSYWIQRNVSEIRQYGAAVADLHRGATEYREERVLLRFSGAGSMADDNKRSSAPLARLVPDDAGLYRASANPSPEAALVRLRRKILSPGPSEGPASETAPSAPVSAAAGSESDLETRIDEPPLAPAKPDVISPALRALVENAGLEAMLEIGSTRTLAGGVFVSIDSAVVLLARSAWDIAAVRGALGGLPNSGPLGRIAVEGQGGVLVVADSLDLARQVIARVAAPGATAAATGRSYAARFNHAGERQRFAALMRLLDNAPGRRPESGDARTPQFFSDNLGSLSATLARVSSETVVRNDTGPAVFETVTYKLAP